jgi:hypothetical protein
MRRIAAIVVSTLALLAFGHAQAFAGAHTWDVYELFSNADGSIQFIELKETGGGNFETGVGGHTVTSLATGSTRTITSNVVSPTGLRSLLFATQSFANLPNAPTPDYIIPPNFFSVDGDTVSYDPYDSWSFGAGDVPTDGVLSMQRNCLACFNSPTNYAGQTGRVNANPPAPAPPGVPDGAAGSTPMTVVANDASATALSVSWDTATCASAATTNIIYGSALPAAPGGAFTVTGSACAIGATSPYVWNPAPTPPLGGLIWWIVVATDGQGAEGSWGKGSDLLERNGTGAAGSSGQCNVTTKKVTNTCGS